MVMLCHLVFGMRFLLAVAAPGHMSHAPFMVYIHSKIRYDPSWVWSLGSRCRVDNVAGPHVQACVVSYLVLHTKDIPHVDPSCCFCKSLKCGAYQHHCYGLFINALICW